MRHHTPAIHTGVAQLRNVRQDEQGRRLGEGDDTVQGGARARGQRGVVEDRRFVARGRQEEVRQVNKLRGSVHAGGGRRHQGVGRAHDPVEVSFFVRSLAYLLGGIIVMPASSACRAAGKSDPRQRALTPRCCIRSR